MVVVESIGKYFGKRKVLKGISFTVKEGEIVAFLGPNGAGKTTTMRIITGYLLPDEGRVSVGGENPSENVEARRLIGYLPENPPFYGELTALEFLSFVGKLRGLKGKLLSERIKYVADRCGISGILKRLIKNLSKGQKQRLGIAQAIVHDPRVLILDEPTIGLDPIQIVEIRNLIKELGKEKTVILSTHILQEAEAVCERAIIINEGEIVAQGSKEELGTLGKLHERIYVRFEGNPSIAEGFSKIPGVVRVEGHDGGYVVEGKKGGKLSSEVARYILSMGGDLIEIRPFRATLEEVFLKLAGGGE